MTRHLVRTMAAVVAAAAMLATAACSGSSAPSSSPSGSAAATSEPSTAPTDEQPSKSSSGLPSGYPKIDWTGTITMAAQSYTPAAPGVSLAPGSAKLQELYKLAKQFEGYYPGVKVEFLGSKFSYNVSDMLPKAAGGQLPDIWFQQFTSVNQQFPKGVVQNLYPALQEPNPYIPGNKKWADVMNQSILSETAAGPTAQYEINGDYVGVSFFYNKDLFEKAGIKQPPTTWAQLIEDCKALQAHGITPGALEIPSSGGYDWLVRIFLGNFLGAKTLKTIDGYSKAPGISVRDQAIAYHNGILDPTKNPRVMAWWPYAKQLFGYFDKAITELPKTPPSGSPSSTQLFAAGKLGLVFQGSWLPNSVANLKSKISIGSFPMPSLAGIDKYATNTDTSADASGPEAAMQWFVSTAKADQSMSEPGKQEAVLNWLRFISTPKRTEAIANELGSFPPTFKGTKPNTALRGIASLIDKPWYQVDGGQFFTDEGSDQIRTLFQQYVLGNISLPDAQQKYASTIQKSYDSYLKSNPIDFSTLS